MEIAFRLPGRAPLTSLAARVWSTHPMYLAHLQSRFPPQEHQVSTAADVDFNEAAVYAPKDEQSAPTSVESWQNVNTVLALHGWLDNASSWDTLVPELLRQWKKTKQHHVVIALDLSGHGLSSHRPWAAGYPMHGYARDCAMVLDMLGWKQFGLLGHSMGGGVSVMLASSFAKECRYLALIENFGPISRPESDTPSQLRTHIEQMTALIKKPVPKYESIEQAVDARIRSDKMLSRTNAMPMLRRGLKPHPQDPSKWTWRTDQQLVLISGMSYSEAQVLEMLKAIQCEILFVLGKQGYRLLPATGEGERPFGWIDWKKRLQTVQRKPTVLEFDGGHHVHLDEKSYQQGLARAVADFMQPSLRSKL